MGTIDKPWNCPHGRPTMRHLMSLGQWNEWDEFGDDDEGLGPDETRSSDSLSAWREFFEENEGSGEDEGDEGTDADEDMNEGDKTDEGESEA